MGRVIPAPYFLLGVVVVAKRVLYAVYVGRHYTASLPEWLGGKVFVFERMASVKVSPEEALWLATRFPYTAQMFYFHDRKGEILTAREIAEIVKQSAPSIWEMFVSEGIIDEGGEWLARVGDMEYHTPKEFPGVREDVWRGT
ncbi:MAG: hypothetical protein ACK42I_02475 [Thermomicrobium sp.]